MNTVFDPAILAQIHKAKMERIKRINGLLFCAVCKKNVNIIHVTCEEHREFGFYFNLELELYKRRLQNDTTNNFSSRDKERAKTEEI